MTDKHAVNIILIITFIVLVIACWRCESTQAAAGAYIVATALGFRLRRAISKWLEKLEQKENSKPL